MQREHLWKKSYLPYILNVSVVSFIYFSMKNCQPLLISTNIFFHFQFFLLHSSHHSTTAINSTDKNIRLNGIFNQASP